MPVLGADIGKKIVVECSVSKFRGAEYVRGTVRELIAGERGGSCGLYVFRSNLLRLKEPKVGVGIEKKTADELRVFIEEKRKSCRYGLLVISSDGAADEFAESLRGMETDIFNLSSQNVGNAYLIAPAADASVSGYRDVVWLDTPADCNIRELAGKRVLVNGEKCGYDDIAALETSRSVSRGIILRGPLEKPARREQRGGGARVRGRVRRETDGIRAGSIRRTRLYSVRKQ